jgi:ubiquinone/menaquinone biosynthesis C-methylase UbiE
VTHLRVRLAAIVLGTLGLVVAGAAPAAAQDLLRSSRVFEAAALRAGHTFCEVGAGRGDVSVAAAEVVGPTGRVFTSELPARLKALQDRVAATGAAHITVVSGEATKTNFPDGTCDAVLLADVYHHLTDPAAMNQAIARALKPQGRLVIVDFTPPGKEAAAPADRGKDGMHGVYPATVIRELKEAGFEEMNAGDSSDRWFLLVFRKRESQL